MSTVEFHKVSSAAADEAEFREYTEKEVPTPNVTFGNVGRVHRRAAGKPLTARQIADRDAVRAATRASVKPTRRIPKLFAVQNRSRSRG